MFMDLEKILPAGVRVLSIEPAHEKDRVSVKLSVGASSDEAKLKLIRSLESSGTFTHIELVAQQHPTSGTSTDQIVVELKAEYLRS